jgi:RIO-like serine/threonine protein kinase
MPNLSTLDDAMLHPGRLVPAVNRLGGGAIALAGTNTPWRVIGTENVVYQLRQPNGGVLALRCRRSDEPNPTLAERYRAFANDPAIKHLRGASSTPIVGNVTYLSDGLTLPAADLKSLHLPVVAMEWVMGPTLLAAADRACRAGDQTYLTALAGAWLTALEVISTAGFVHGNLTSDNAVVRPGAGIAFVDYDTATWSGSPPAVRDEAAPSYFHPKGDAKSDDRQDRFAALVIYTSLRILAEWPALRNDYGDPPTEPNGSLLFKARDLAEPDASPLFGALRVNDDVETRALIAVLREATKSSADDVPPLHEVVEMIASMAHSKRPRRMRPTSDPRERQRRLTRLNSLLLAGDDEAARQYWRSSGLEQDPEAIREVGARIAEIDRRRKLREARDAAVTGNSAAVLDLWDKGHLDDFRPAAPLKPVVESAKRRSESVDRVQAAIEHRDAAVVIELWPEVRSDPSISRYAIDAHVLMVDALGNEIASAIEHEDDDAIIAAITKSESAGIAVDINSRKAARAAVERKKVRQELQQAIASDDREALASLAISGRLERSGEVKPEHMQLVVRALAWPHLVRALESDDDTAITGAYDGEVYALADSLSQQQRARIDLARRRLFWLDAVRSALKKRDTPGLRALLGDIPNGAAERLSDVERVRIERTTSKDHALRQLHSAIQQGEDATILNALNDLESAGATLPEAVDWNTLRGLVDRVSLASAIKRALASDPPDYQRLMRLLPAAKEAAGGTTPDLGEGIDFEQVELDVRRHAQRNRLREALKIDDDKLIVAAALPDLYGSIDTLSPGEQVRVQRAIESVKQPRARTRT